MDVYGVRFLYRNVSLYRPQLFLQKRSKDAPLSLHLNFLNLYLPTKLQNMGFQEKRMEDFLPCI